MTNPTAKPDANGWMPRSGKSQLLEKMFVQHMHFMKPGERAIFMRTEISGGPITVERNADQISPPTRRRYRMTDVKPDAATGLNEVVKVMVEMDRKLVEKHFYTPKFVWKNLDGPETSSPEESA